MTCLSVSEKMDSQVQVEGRLLDVVDDQWRTETLPLDDIHVGDLCLIFQHYSPPMVFWSSSEAIGCKKYLNLIFKVPATELPDPEADNANPGDSLRQQVDKKNLCCIIQSDQNHLINITHQLHQPSPH